MSHSVLPEENRDLLEAPVVAHLATSRPDGDLQSNPVWFEWDGEHVLISQTRSRQKMANIDHDPHVALSITDPDNPYRYVELRGVVEDVREDEGRELIDRLSQRYLNQSPYPNDEPGTERVVVAIRPTSASSMAA